VTVDCIVDVCDVRLDVVIVFCFCRFTVVVAVSHRWNGEDLDILVMLRNSTTSRIHVDSGRDGERFAGTQQENDLAALLETRTYDV